MENNNEVDFSGIDLSDISGDAGEMVEVNVPAAVETEEGSTEDVASTQNEEGKTEGNKDQDPNLIEVPDGPVAAAEEEKTETPSQQDPPGESKTDSPSDAKIATLAKALQDEGILSEVPEDFNGTLEGLFALVKGEVSSRNKSYVDGLPANIKEIIENYQENVPLDQLIANKSKAIEFANITDESIAENADLAKNLIFQDLANRGYSEEKIKSRIKLFEDNETLVEEAKDAKAALTDLQVYNKGEMVKKAAADKTAAEEQGRKTLEDLRKGIDDTDEIIPGIALNKVSRDKVYNSMTQVVGQTQDGRPMNAVMATRQEDPVAFEKTLHYLHSIGVFKGDWSKLTAAKTTTAAKELAELLNSDSSEFSGGRNSGHAKPGKSSTLEGLGIFAKE